MELLNRIPEKQWFRYHRLGSLPVVLIFCLLTPWRADAMEKVIISHSVRLSATVAPLFYGIYRGFFRDENIDLEYRVLKTDLGVTAMLNSEVDYIYSAGTGIRAAMRGIPIRVLYFDLDRLPHFLMGRPEIKTGKDLKGKIVGVSSFGASADISARACLKSFGLDLKEDVTVVAMGSPSIRLQGLKNGSVAAIPVPLPENIALKKEGFSELCYAGRLLKGAVSGLVASVQKIQQNPEQVKGMLRGLLRTSRSLSKEKNRFVDFLVSQIKVDRDAAEQTATVLIEGQTPDGLIQGEDLQTVIDGERRVANIKKQVTASEVVDYTLLREVLNQEKNPTASQ
jgi:ABC-type nitrate/sulfonate/bicarbonate transport system substrate-binding protein